MTITNLYRALLALTVSIVLAGCSASPTTHASGSRDGCNSASHSTGAACATVQVQAAR